MICSPLFILTLAVLAGGGPQARSAAYLKNHADEDDQVIAACRSGEIRSVECTHADQAKSNGDRKARVEMFKRGSEGR